MPDNIYETRRLLDEYLLFHYAEADDVMPWSFGPREALGFAVRSVTQLIDKPTRGRALDLGCAVGRSSFKLAQLGYEVIGIDYSQSFIDAAKRLQQGQEISYDRVDEGSQRTVLSTQVAAGQSVKFEQGDAMALRSDLGSYDVVHAANLLCRLTQPQRLLSRLPELVRPGGQLLVTTPCTWLADFTPPEHWPQGSTLEWLTTSLERDFELEHQQDLPFLIREHARKYQWSVAQGSRWRRRTVA
jgi:putative 4-mercaptohistidine N1-methyltranferase